MKITILGSAGAFDFGETSASFLLEIGDKNVLIDCGHNVLKKLKEKGFMTKENNIDVVFITHLHMDHVADLESLIYYNYFILGKRLEIFIPEELKKDFFNMFPYEKYSNVYQNGSIKEIGCMYEIKTSYSLLEYDEPVYLKPFKANHPGAKAYGYEIKKRELKKYGETQFSHELKTKVIISGDSKANFELLEIAENALKNDFYDAETPLYIFHDFSNWNDVTRNIHCCVTDFNLVYSDLINGKNKEIVKFIKYHNNDNVGLQLEV